MANSFVGYIALLRQLASFCKGWVLQRFLLSMQNGKKIYHTFALNSLIEGDTGVPDGCPHDLGNLLQHQPHLRL